MGQWFAQLSGEVQLALIALLNVVSVAIITAWREARKPPPFSKPLEDKGDLNVLAGSLESLNMTLMQLRGMADKGLTNAQDFQRTFNEILNEVEEIKRVETDVLRELRELRMDALRQESNKANR